MAVRNDFTAGEVLAAADLNDTFGSRVPFAYGTATPTTTVEGFIWYDENDTPPAPKFWDGSAFETFGGGKVLQVVRATHATNRSITAGAYTDVTGMTITITPQKSDSIILVIMSAFIALTHNADVQSGLFRITDASNNALSGTEQGTISIGGYTGASSRTLSVSQTIIGYSTPATISPVTYKVRAFATGTIQFSNATSTGQMYAIEVSA
jgi:hypothetical protein